MRQYVVLCVNIHAAGQLQTESQKADLVEGSSDHKVTAQTKKKQVGYLGQWLTLALLYEVT